MVAAIKSLRSQLPSPPQSNDERLGREASLDPSGAIHTAPRPIYGYHSHFEPAAANDNRTASDLIYGSNRADLPVSARGIDDLDYR